LKGALQRAALFFSIRRVRNEALSGISRQ
jgi:hypothetical protein